MIDPTHIHPAIGFGLPMAGSLAFLGIRGWGIEKSKRRKQVEEFQLIEAARNARPPTGAVPICRLGAPEEQADRSGRIMAILDGTFSVEIGSDLFSLLARCNMDGVIGSILLIEMDRRRRERFMARVPAVFRDRIITVEFPALAGGLGNRDPDEVQDLIDRWGPVVIKRANEVCELHQRLHQGEEAALALVFVSQGGQAVLGTKAVETIARNFRLARFYGFTALPVDDRLRVRVERILEEYRKVGLQGFVTGDNLGDELRNDFGMVASIAGFAAAAENADAAVEQNNAWYLLFREAPGGLVSYSTYARNLPGYPVEPRHPSVPARYCVYKGSVVSTILAGLAEVHRPEYDSLRGHGRDGHEPLTSRFDIVLAAIPAWALKEDEDDIVLGQHLKGQDKRNYHLLFAPITTVVDPERVFCPVAVVSLRALRHPEATLKQLTIPVQSPMLPPDQSESPGNVIHLPNGEQKRLA